MECNHIVPEADGGPDTLENCIPLCFDCHAEVGSYNNKHPKGNKITPAELRAHRDRWFEKMKNAAPVHSNEAVLNLDRGLFSKIKERLPFDSLMIHFRDHDYGGSFDSQYHDSLLEFIRWSEDPSIEFLDERMQGAFRSLLSSLHEFRRFWGNRLWLDDNALRVGRRELSIPREWRDGDDAVRNEKRWDEARTTLNKSATEYFESYQSFIKIGRRLLAVE